MNIILICFTGALGVLTRHLLDSSIKFKTFPLSTFTANMVGCFLAGILFTLIQQKTNHSNIYNAILIGFCGGLTTFSSYALQSLTLGQGSLDIKAVLYFVLTPVLGLGLLYLGSRVGIN